MACHGVLLCADGFGFFLAAELIQNTVDGVQQGVQLFQVRGKVITERRVVNAGAAGDVRADQDTFRFQRGNDDRSRRDQRSGDTSAEMAAAPVILKTVVFDIGSVIGMAGPYGTPFVIPAAGIRVGNQERCFLSFPADVMAWSYMDIS